MKDLLKLLWARVVVRTSKYIKISRRHWQTSYVEKKNEPKGCASHASGFSVLIQLIIFLICDLAIAIAMVIS